MWKKFYMSRDVSRKFAFFRFYFFQKGGQARQLTQFLRKYYQKMYFLILFINTWSFIEKKNIEKVTILTFCPLGWGFSPIKIVIHFLLKKGVHSRTKFFLLFPTIFCSRFSDYYFGLASNFKKKNYFFFDKNSRNVTWRENYFSRHS